jgi:hypothetical protein
MGDQAERVVLEAEDQVSPVVDKANTSLDGFEKKATTAHEKVVRITDQTRTSVQRLVASLEKQAETFGKTGVDKLVSQRDQLLQRYSKEPQAIDAITRSYEKMIAVEEKAAREASAAKAAKEAQEALEKQSKSIESFGERIGRFIENPIEGAKGAVGGLVLSMGTIGTVVAAGAAVLVGFGVAAFEAAKALAEYGLQTHNLALRTGLATKEVEQFNFAARMTGQDGTVYERMMRGLSQAADENSKEGEKARGTLQRLGVDLRAVTGDMKPTSEILTEISTALTKLPEGMERNAAAMDLFKRAGIEAIPTIVGLTENIKRAKELGLGATDEDLKRWEEYHRNVTEAEVLWERFTRKIKEPLAAVVTFLFKDGTSGTQYSLEDLAKRGVNLGKYAPRTPYQDEQAAKAAGFGNPQREEWEANITRDSLLSYTGKIEARKRADDAVRAMDAAEGLEGQLKAAEAALQKITKPEVGKVKSVDEVNEYTAAEKHVADLKNQIAAAKHGAEELTSFRRSAAEFEKKASEAELDAVGKIYYQRDQLIAQAQKLKGTEADIAAIRKSADEQAGKIRSAEAAKFDLDWRKFEEYAQEDQAKRSTKMMAGLGPSKEEMKEWEDWFKAVDQVNSIAADAQKEALNRQAGQAQKMVGLSGATGMDAIRQTYEIRIDLAKQLANVEADRILKETSGAEQLVDGAKAMKVLNKEIADAQEEATIRQLELQKQQMESLKKDTEGLWNTLLMHPAKFPKQLASTVHEAVIKPVAEGMASMTANILHPAIYGADGSGGLAGIFKGIFGGSKPADPVKISTDQNTTATILNTAHVAALTAVLAGAMGMTAPAVAAPAGIAGLAGVSMPSISVPARMTAVNIGGGGAAAGTESVSTYSGLPSPDRVAQTLGISGSGAPYGSGAGGSYPSALANLPLSHQSPLFQMLAPGLGGGKQGFPGLSGLESSVWNTKAYHGLPIDQTTAAGQLASGGLAVATSPAATAAGIMLATSGLMGKQMGSWGGVGMGTVGGGLLGAGIGMQAGGPMGAVLGAGIGAIAGFGIGVGEKLAGIESPQVKAHDDIKSIYGVDIPQNSGTIKQVVSIAQSEFGNDIAVAVRSPKVRQLVMLYSEATGQKMPLSASTPYAGSLAEQGGNLYQQASFQNNAWHSYASDLPTLGGLGGTTFPTTPGPNTTAGGSTYVSLNINGQPITSDFVADQSLAAQNASYGRTQQSANLQVPGLMVA